MTTTIPTRVRTRTSQCLAATALIAGLALGAAPIAGAAELDVELYDDCTENAIQNHPSIPLDLVIEACCVEAGGKPKTGADGTAYNCMAPPAEQSGPGSTGPTVKPGAGLVPQAPNNGIGPAAGKPGATPVTVTPGTIG